MKHAITMIIISIITILFTGIANAKDTATTDVATNATSTAIKLPAPEITKTEIWGTGGNIVSIYWKDTPEAVKYNIYTMKYMGQELTPESIKNHSEKKTLYADHTTVYDQTTFFEITSYDDVGKYYFIVTAIDKNGNESDPSEHTSVKLNYNPY